MDKEQTYYRVMELAEVLDITWQTIYVYTAIGMPVHRNMPRYHPKGGTVYCNVYNINDVKKWMKENNRTGRDGRPRKRQAEVVTQGIQKILALCPTDIQKAVENEVYCLVEAVKGRV